MLKIISFLILLISISRVDSNRQNESNFELNECRSHVIYIANKYPTPLYENIDGSPKTIAAVHRNENGYITFDIGEKMIISCKGSYLIYHGLTYENTESAELICTPDGLFSPEWIPEKQLLLPHIICASSPPFIEMETNRSCGEENKGNIVQVAVQSALNRDHVVYETCFSENTALPLYVQFSVDNQNYHTQNYPGELRYTGRSQRYKDLYVQFRYDDQVAAVEKLVGSKYWDYYKYGDEFKIGPLYTQKDIVFNPFQRATYSFVNTMPHWNRIHDGNWAAVKLSVLKLMDIERGVIRNLTIYCGGWGLLSLKDGGGIDIDIYLEPDTKRLPVPLWLYQVVYEPSTKTSIAFLVLNNPHVLVDEAKALAEEFCPVSVCPKDDNFFTWRVWTENDVKKGFVHCCNYEDFSKKIKDLPELDVAGLFFPEP